MSTDFDIEEEIQTNEDIGSESVRDLMIYNDDFNTFDHVINTLIYACDHEENQAHQCALLVHYKGKCSVKSGDYKDLEPRCSKLLQAGLSAEIV